MNRNTQPYRLRVHVAELKAKLLVPCREAGASVAAVAMANALNANLVRKWLVGRGLARSGPAFDSGDPTGGWPVPGPTARPEASAIAAPALQFVPVSVPAQRQNDVASVAMLRSHTVATGNPTRRASSPCLERVLPLHFATRELRGMLEIPVKSEANTGLPDRTQTTPSEEGRFSTDLA